MASISDIKNALDASVTGSPEDFGYPPISLKGPKNKPIILRKRDERRFRARASLDRITSLSAAPSSFATAQGIQVPFQLTSMQTEVVRRCWINFNITNNLGGTVYPTATPFWIQRVEIYAGASYLETIYPEQIMCWGLLENSDTAWYDISSVQNQTLTFPLNGFHNPNGIVNNTTTDFFIELPSHSVTGAFLYCPALSAPLRYVVYLNGNNIYTTPGTGLTINYMNFFVEGIQYAPEARDRLLKLHQAAPFVMRCETFQQQIITLGNLPASGSIQQTLTGMGIGIASQLLWFIRPTSATGANYFENNYAQGYLTSFTDDKNTIIANSLPPNFLSTLLTSDYEGSFRSNAVYMLPWTLSGKASSEGLDVGGVILSNTNSWTVQTIAATANSQDVIFMAKLKSVFILTPDGNLTVIKL
jgi:hypothetical protein